MPATGDAKVRDAARPGPVASQAHRRPPAARSVSLRHSPTLVSQKLLQEVKQAHATNTSPSEPSSLDNNKNSSGETSNAERWFEKSNNNVRGNSASFVDDDPPFYHRDSSNESPPNDPNRSANPSMNQAARFRPGAFEAVFSTGSSSEEYRSVIDDLTIENRKLKAKLRKYAPYKDKLDQDRLFEVKVHGLPAAKKRELDELLARFAQTLNGSPYSGSSGAAMSGRSPGAAIGGYTPRRLVNPTANTTKTSPQLKFTDSGYGSATLSGQTPTAHSGSSSASQQYTSHSSVPNNSLNLPPQVAQSQNAKDQSIRSYLHDIPEGLLPRHSVAMTEKTKKRIVVRRLEQIFAGRGAATGGHQLPLQQQEVSNSAARADRTAIEAQGQIVSKEGVREAHIMELDDDTDMVKSDAGISPPNPNDTKDQPKTTAHRMHPAEQRPTRPLDLDPHRAQIPADNMEYFRHLGFDVPENGTQLSGSDTWIYLNLLINMAQLHTVNVTTEFVKRAISENSSKLELSNDGRKVRWKGDASRRRLPKGMISIGSSTAEASVDGSTDSHDESGKSRKRPRLAHEESSEGSEDPQHVHSMSHKSNAVENKFSYTPLFSHKNSQGESNETSLSDSESIASSALPDEVTGGSSSMRRMMNSKRRENGPIVFYNNANFCTDLSGDTRQTASPNPTAEYIPYSVSAVGANLAPGRARRMFSSAKDSPLYRGKPGPNAEPADEDVSMSGLSPTTSSPKRVQFAETPEIEFEVSGLGGVRPADHLAITVVRQRRSVPSVSPAESSGRSPKVARHPSRQAPQPASRTRLSKVFANRTSPPSLSSVDHIVSTHRLSLPPSELPPPSLAMAISDSGSDDSDDEDSDESPALFDTTSHTISAPQPMQLTSFGSDASGDHSENNDDNDDNDDEHDLAEDDGVIDLLAVARKIDPASIHAREREYDAEMAERLAEEIPAGSSAATAGGGSGFNSPDMAIDDADMGVSDAGVGEVASIAS